MEPMIPRSENQPPKVFISHSGQDKERFVLQFAKRLRDKGIEAWLDVWEMNPGDSLVDKIFEEGLKGCDAMIVVLSMHSIASKWVREELNAGMVKKIENKTKLIPIRLDGCEVPECLLGTIWQDIPDPQKYDQQLERILNAIYGQYDKPPLGERPPYVRPDVLDIGDPTRIDSVIFEASCRMAIEADCPLINPDPLVAALAGDGVSESQIMDTLEILENRSYIKVHRTMGPPHVDAFSVQALGFDRYVHAAIPDFGKICTDVATLLVRNESMSHRGIAQQLTQPVFIIEHVFRLLEAHSLIKFAESTGGGVHLDAYWVSPELRRKLEASGRIG